MGCWLGGWMFVTLFGDLSILGNPNIAVVVTVVVAVAVIFAIAVALTVLVNSC